VNRWGDLHLVLLARGGNRQAEATFLDRHERYLRTMLAQLAPALPAQEAEDLEQAIRLGAVEGIRSFDQERGGRPVQHVFITARRAGLDFIRRQARFRSRNSPLEAPDDEENEGLEDPGAEQPDAEHAAKYARVTLEYLFSALPPAMRYVARARFWCEPRVPLAAVAATLNVSERTAKRLQEQASKLMRERALREGLVDPQPGEDA